MMEGGWGGGPIIRHLDDPALPWQRVKAQRNASLAAGGEPDSEAGLGVGAGPQE